MLKITVKVPKAGMLEGDIATRVMRRFAVEAGPAIVNHIRTIIGTDEMGLILSANYAKRKPRMPEFRRYPGKSTDQPGILSGDMYENIDWELVEGDVIRVQVDAEHGLSPGGFDYAELLESRTGFLENGFDDLLEPLSVLLLETVMLVMEL